LELDPLSNRHRFWKVFKELGITPAPGMIDIWNLRGHATGLDKLVPKLIRRALKKRYQLIVIDPIYKVLTGDENSAEQMAIFCNQFDRLCNELNAAVVYCHHHSKGAQGQKNSRDRSSGSGVFARDPDAIIDIIELSLDDNRRKQIVNRWECDAMHEMLDAVRADWRQHISQDDAIVGDRLAEWCDAQGLGDQMRSVRSRSRESAEIATAWRIEGTVREFPAFQKRNAFYRYPLHVADEHGLLVDAKADGEEPPWQAKRKDKKQSASERRHERQRALGS
jgi:RecA-family ATPase